MAFADRSEAERDHLFGGSWTVALHPTPKAPTSSIACHRLEDAWGGRVVTFPLPATAALQVKRQLSPQRREAGTRP